MGDYLPSYRHRRTIAKIKARPGDIRADGNGERIRRTALAARSRRCGRVPEPSSPRAANRPDIGEATLCQPVRDGQAPETRPETIQLYGGDGQLLAGCRRTLRPGTPRHVAERFRRSRNRDGLRNRLQWCDPTPFSIGDLWVVTSPCFPCPARLLLLTHASPVRRMPPQLATAPLRF